MKSVTYVPKTGTIIEGSHEHPVSNPLVLAKDKIYKETLGASTVDKFGVELIDRNLKTIRAKIMQRKNAIMTTRLNAAEFETGRSELEELILVRLHQQIRGEQEEWFWLTEMYETVNIDDIVYRMSFQNNPRVAMRVPTRREYDTTKITYTDINFSLPKVVTSWDIAIEDKLRALIDPVSPLKKNNDFSLKYFREQEALDGLNELMFRYRKDLTGRAKFNNTAATANNGTQRISDPNPLTNFHSDNRTVDQIQAARVEFLKLYDANLTHCAMSPSTVSAIAANTNTEQNTINSVEAYRTTGSIRPFPGISGATAVVSSLVPNNVLYWVAKHTGVLTLAEGPKISNIWEDPKVYTTQAATADFHQYKCAVPDFDSDFTRRFGVIMDLEN